MNQNRKAKKWTKSEEQRTLRQVRAFPQNMSKCFHIVAEEIGRSPGAVAAKWYTDLSKRPNVLEFATISSKHVCKNRKNGMGVESTPSLWRRIVALIKNL